jgi:cyclopropane-fatty-acyl-phospholipid synthase
MLQCIAKMKESSGSDAFIRKHVFPGYWFNSLEGMTRRAVDRNFNVLDMENLRPHYALTAQHWRQNFLTNYDEIRSRFAVDDVFMRVWEFYLASVVAGFRVGYLNLIQMTMSNGLPDEYPLTRSFLYEPRSESAGASGTHDRTVLNGDGNGREELKHPRGAESIAAT